MNSVIPNIVVIALKHRVKLYLSTAIPHESRPAEFAIEAIEPVHKRKAEIRVCVDRKLAGVRCEQLSHEGEWCGAQRPGWPRRTHTSCPEWPYLGREGDFTRQDGEGREARGRHTVV